MFNTDVLTAIISDYKKDFDNIHKEEIYKWKAVKCFQDNWDEKAPDFPLMLNRSFEEARNLLTSYNHYPKVMIYEIAKKEPEAVRVMFKELFNNFQPCRE